MKTPKYQYVFFICAVILCVLGSLCGILVWATDMLMTSKFSFTVIIVGAVGVADYYLTKALSTASFDENAKALEGKQFEINLLKEEMSEKDKKISELKAALETAEKLPADNKNLQKKCDAIEKFRNSFPYTVSNGYILYNIMRTELLSTHSKWMLAGEYNGKLWSCSIYRPDSQSFNEMLTLAAATEFPDKLQELDMREELLWA